MSGWQWADRAWDEIVPGLWQGGHYYTGGGAGTFEAIVGDEFDWVVSLHSRWGHGPDVGVEQFNFRIPDGALSSEQQDRACALGVRVWDAVSAGRTVLVRCNAGLNRSGLVVAHALVEGGMTADEAVARIRERRSPHALFNQHFLTYLGATA